MSQADTHVHPDALELAQLLRQTWPEFSEELRLRPTLICEGDADAGKGDSGDAGDGDGDKGDAGDGDSGRPDNDSGDSDDGKTFDAKYVKKLRDEAARYRTEARDAQAKVKQFEDASKSDGEKLEERTKTAEANASKAEQEAARLRVALRKGLTETQAKRLVGESEEELEQDADELLESFKQDDGKDGQEPRRRPKERLRPGAAPGAEPEETDPRKLAAAVSRDY